jgi:hypothetical protein
VRGARNLFREALKFAPTRGMNSALLQIQTLPGSRVSSDTSKFRVFCGIFWLGNKLVEHKIKNAPFEPLPNGAFQFLDILFFYSHSLGIIR